MLLGGNMNQAEDLITLCNSVIDEKHITMVLKTFNNIIKDLTRKKLNTENPDEKQLLDDKINKVKTEITKIKRNG